MNLKTVTIANLKSHPDNLNEFDQVKNVPELTSGQHLALINTNTNEGKISLLVRWGFPEKEAEQAILSPDNLTLGYDAE